jgi:hypothetical protein
MASARHPIPDRAPATYIPKQAGRPRARLPRLPGRAEFNAPRGAVSGASPGDSTCAATGAKTDESPR